MSRECRLTTMDNPYDPFEQFNQWLMFDKEHDYNTCEYLARMSQPRLTDDMSQTEENAVIENVIDEIIETFPIGLYKKVCKNEEASDAESLDEVLDEEETPEED